jgi:hypothetical protein
LHRLLYRYHQQGREDESEAVKSFCEDHDDDVLKKKEETPAVLKEYASLAQGATKTREILTIKNLNNDYTVVCPQMGNDEEQTLRTALFSII